MQFRESNMNQAELYELAQGQTAIFSRKSPYKDGVNEDSALLLPLDENRAILAVADGLGGRLGGAGASQTAINHLEQIASQRPEPDDLRGAVIDAFERANLEVMANGIGSCTTLIAVEVVPTGLRTYHAGDSSALLFDAKGEIKLETIPHSPVGYALAAGLIDDDEAFAREDRHLVSNVLGAESMHIDISTALHCQPGDTLVLASDGLFDTVRITEVREFVTSNGVLEATAELASLAMRRMCGEPGEQQGKPDDLTIVLHRFG